MPPLDAIVSEADTIRSRARAASRPAGSLLTVEGLEPRVLLSADLNPLKAGVLTSSLDPADPSPNIVYASSVLMAATQAVTADPAPAIQGTLAVPGQVDRYTFTVTTPRSVYFDSLTNRGDITWSLTGPSGSLVASRAFNSSDADAIDGSAAFLLGASAYTLTVAGNGTSGGGGYGPDAGSAAGGATGDYAFRLLDLSTATPITPGVAIGDTLSPGNRTDAYSFAGTAGSRIYLQAQGGSSLYWRVLDQYGQLVGANGFADQQLVLPSTGTYTLLVEGQIGQAAPSRFGFELFAENDTAQPLAINGPVLGALTQPGQADHYSFTLATPTALSFDALTPSPGLSWTLTGPRGTEVSARSLGASDAQNGTSDLVLPAGTYSLTVSGSGSNKGSYGFQLLDFAAATPISYGVPVSATLGDGGAYVQLGKTAAQAPGTETRAYSFAATAGDQVRLDAPAIKGSIYYRLFDPFGTKVREGTLGDGAVQTLLMSGTYTLLIEGNIANTAPAGYTVTLANPAKVAIPPLTGAALTLGTPVSLTATTTNETDDYIFTVAAPTRLLFTPLSSYTNARWQLDGPPGTVVTQQGFYSPTRIDLVAPGTYRLRVTGAYGGTYDSGDGIPSSTVAFLLADLAAASPIRPGVAVSGTLPLAAPVLTYSISGNPGDRLFLHALSSSGTASLRLVDPYGRDVFNTNFGDQRQVTLADTGAYTLIVSGATYNQKPASFSFVLQPVTDISAPLAFNTDISAVLNVPGDTVRYNFALSTADTLFFDALSQNGALQWSLVGPRGTEVASTAIASYGNALLSLPAGSYTLTVRGSGNTTGPFSFRMLDLATAAPISYGATVTAQLAASASVAAWQFTATAGDRVFIDPTVTPGYGAQMRIVDPFGRDVWNNGAFAATGVLTLACTGQYSVIVGPYSPAYDGETGTTFAGAASVGFTLSHVVDVTEPVTVDGPAMTGPLSVPGQIGQALRFTGAEQVSVQSSPALGLRTAATVEFWVKPDTLAPTWQSLVYKGDGIGSASRTYAVSLNGAGYVMLSTSDASGNQTVQTAAGSVPQGVWTHIAALMDRAGGTLSIYVNGVLAATAPVRTGPATGTAGPLLIGAAVEGYSAFRGALDDVRVFGAARSAAAISADYGVPLTGTEAGLALYLPMNDATGTTRLADRSANASTATVSSSNVGLAGTITGQIATPGQAHRYTFSLTAPTVLVFDALADNSNLTVTLTGPGGLSAVRNMRNGDSTEFGTGNPAIAALAGDYTVTVTDTGDRTDPYAFRFIPLSDATRITLGTDVSATQAQGAATQAYSFKATAGDQLLLNVRADNKGSDRATVRLIDPAGNQVFGPSNLVAAGPYTAARTGTYTLLVEGRVFDQAPLSYTIRVGLVGDQVIPLTLGTNPNPGPQHDTGEIGGALRFTGSDAVTVPAALASAGNVTLEAWINVDRLPSEQTAIIYQGTGSTFGASLSLDYYGRALLSVGQPNGGMQTAESAGGLIAPGAWHHVAGVIDRLAGLLHLYVDGVDVSDGYTSTISTGTAGTGPAGLPLTIGAAPGDNGSFANFQGRIDEVRVWSVARTASQIATGKDMALPPGQTGLALYLPFDETTGTTAADASGNGLTATLQRENADGITGTIKSPGQPATYGFTLAAATRIALISQSPLSNFYWTLTGPGGIVVNARPLSQSGVDSTDPVLNLQAGSYRLSFSADSGVTGSFNAALIDLATATPIAPGTPVAVTLQPGNRAVAYSFGGTAGERVDFSQAAYTGSVYVRVIDPLCRDLIGAQYAGSLSSLATQTLPLTGTYTILLGGSVTYGPNSAAVTFNVTPVVDKTAVLTIGTAVSGSIDNAGQAASYAFTLAQAHQVLFDSLTNKGNLAWALTGPDGFVVGARSFAASDSYDLLGAAIQLAAGSYTLTVRGSGSATGAFAFNLLDTSQAVALVPNTPVQINLPARTTQLFSISGTAGERLTVFGTVATGTASWRLIDPSGAELSAPQDLSNGRGPVTLTTTGTYIIAVEGRVNDGSAVSASIEAIPLAVPEAAGAVSVAVPATSAVPVDLGIFAAGTYTLTGTGVVALSGTTSDPYALLFNPDGTLETPTAISGYTGFNMAPSAINPGDGQYGVGGAGQFLGGLIGTLAAGPGAGAGYFTIGKGATITLTSAGHIYAQVNDVPAGFSNNQYGYVVNVLATTPVAPGPVQAFDGAGTPYALTNYGGAAAAVVPAVGMGGNALRLTSVTSPYQTNVADFSATATGPFDAVQVGFDMRVSPGGVTALAAVLLDTTAWGLSGPSAAQNTSSYQSYGTDPAAVGALGIKLTGSGASTQVTLSWNGATVVMATGIALNNGAWDHVRIVLQRTDGGALASVVLTSSAGAASTVINQAFVGGYTLGTSRLALAGSTSYQAAAQDVANVTVVTAPSATAMPILALGATVSGTLAQAGAVRAYGLDLATASNLVFNSLTPDDQISWTLTGPNGMAVVRGRSFNASDSIDLPGNPVLNLAAGHYVLTVAKATGSGYSGEYGGGQSSSTGAYAFRLLDLASATALTIGTPAAGTLDPGNGIALYTFAATAGQRIAVSNLTGWNGSQYYVLVGPASQLVIGETALSRGTGPIQLPFSGTYTLLLSGRSAVTSTSNYSLTVSAVTDQLSVLTPNTPVSGVLTAGGQAALYSFTLGAATSVYFDSRTNSNGLTWTLTGPGGVPYANGVFGSGDNGPIRVPSGAYTLTVRSTSVDQGGAYAFNLLDLSHGTALTPGTPVTASLDPANPATTYTFAATAGQQFFFDTSIPAYGLRWELIDPNGAAVFSDDLVPQGRLTLGVAGQYALLVTGATYTTGTPGYSFNVQPLTTTTAALTIGAATNGAIALPSQTNLYTFTLAASTQVLPVALSDMLDGGAAGGRTLTWTLTGPNGTVATRALNASDGSNFGAGASPVLTLAAGTYTFAVSASDHQTGGYSFRLLDLGQAIPITPGTGVAGTLAPGSDARAYSFSGTAGDTLFFQQSSLSGGSAVWRLLDPNGKQVFYAPLSSSPGQFVLPATGTYILTVEGAVADAATAVTYAFIADPNPASNPVPIGETSAQGADLVVAGLTATGGAQIQSGGTLTIAWTDANTGSLPTDAPWTDRVIVRRTDTQEILADVIVGSAGPLAAGDGARRQAAVHLPEGARGTGALTIAVTTDVGNTVTERNGTGAAYSNNTATLAVMSVLAPYPDLVVTRVALSPAAGYVAGQTVTAGWTLANTGLAATSVAFTELVTVRNTQTNQVVAQATDTVAAGFTGSAARSLSFVWPPGYASTGLYAVTVTADSAGQVIEAVPYTSHTDNIGRATVLSAPDMAVSGLVVTNTDPLQAGDTINLAWTDRNLGNAATPVDWTDHVQVVDARTGLVLLDQAVAAGGPLGAGLQRARSVSFRLPDGSTGVGTFNVTVTADQTLAGGNALLEAVAGGNPLENNVSQIAITSAMRGYPDLKPVVTVPATGLGGTPIALSWTVTNSGTHATVAGAWTDRVILSRTPKIGTADDVVLGNFTHAGDLGIGGSYTQTQSVTLPRQLDGTVYVSVVTDKGAAVLEPDSRAHTVSAAAPIAVTSFYADLTTGSVSAPAVVQVGGSITVGWTVTNAGSAATSVSAWQDQVYLSQSATVQPTDPLVTTVAHNGRLAAGGTYDASTTFTLPPNLAGAWRVLVVADATNQVYGTALAGHNTAASAPITVVSADLQASAVTAPASIQPGQSQTITWTVTNAGQGNATGAWYDRVLVSATGKLADAVPLADLGHIGGLVAEASYTASIKVTVPALPDGPATFFVVADRGAAVFELNGHADAAAAAAPSTVTHAFLAAQTVSAPGAALAGQPVTVSWTVTDTGTATATGSWTDLVYISQGTTLGDAGGYRGGGTPSPLLLGTVAHTGPVAGGGSYTATLTAALPQDLAAGSYHILVVANGNPDPEAAVGVPGNLAVSAAVTVTQPPLPDLQVAGLSVTPGGGLRSGSVITLSWQARNAGPGPVLGSFYSHVVVINTTTGKTVADQQVRYDAAASGPIAGQGGSALQTLQLALPDGDLGVGTLTFTVTADSKGPVYEGPGPHADNTATITRVSTLQDYPDLIVSNLDADPAPASNGPLTVTWTTFNQGAAAAATAFSDRVTITSQATGAVLATQLLAYDPAVAGPVAAGTGLARRVTLALPPGSAGAVLIRVTADALGQVTEQVNEGRTDNLSTLTRVATAAATPRLVVRNVVTPASTQAGASIQVSYTVTNTGPVAATGDATDVIALTVAGLSATADTALLSVPTPGEAIAAGATVTRTASVTLPANIDGQIKLAIITDATAHITQDDRSGTRALSANITVVPALAVSVSSLTVAEDAGVAALTVTVTRSGSTATDVTVTLAADATALNVPATVVIPAGQAGASVAIGAVDDGKVTTTRTATITAATAGFAPGVASVNVTNTDVAALTVTTATPVVDKATGTMTITVTRNAGLDHALTATLSADFPDRLSPPPRVSFAVGQASVDVQVVVLNNGAVEGLRQVELSAAADGLATGGVQVSINDSNVPSLTLTLGQTAVSEAAGNNATTLTITRDKGLDQAIDVTIQSNLSHIRLPAHAAFAAGVSSMTVPVAVINQQQPASGAIVVTIRASVSDSGFALTIPGSSVETLIQVNGSVGPALALTLDQPTLNGGQTTTGTVTRSGGDNTQPLKVVLSSSNTTEATVPTTVTFAANQTTATFTVTSLDDGQRDSRTAVTLLADAAGYIEGAAGLVVTDIHQPDLQVTSVVVPGGVVAGQPVTISYTVKNTGLLVATAPFVDQVFLNSDLMLTASAKLEGTVAGQTLAPGQSYTATVTFTAPDTPGLRYVIVQTNATGAIQELNQGNNIDAAALTINPSFRATVAIAQRAVPAGRAVALSGAAYDALTGAFAPGQVVSIDITAAGGFIREVQATTDDTGHYQATFVPLSSELGDYTVDAAQSGVQDRVTQDTFSLIGATCTSSALSIGAVPGTPVSGQFVLKNGSSVALTGLSVSVPDLPPDAVFSFQTIPDLVGNTGATPGQVTVQFSFTSSTPLSGTSSFVITSAEGATIVVPLSVSVVPAFPQLVADPGTLDTGMVIGTNSQISFTVKNTGGADSGPLTVQLPDVPWLSLGSPAVIDNIAVGGTVAVTLNLTAAQDLALQEYTGAIVLNGATASLSEGFTFRAVTSATCTAAVSVEDEYTYFAADKPLVAGATVVLSDVYTGQTVASAVTDGTGIVHFDNLTAGPYTLTISADQHATFNSTVILKPGTDNQLAEFLHRQLVSYTWTVVPTQVPDNYTVQLVADYQTAVPAPVVTVSDPFRIVLVQAGSISHTTITLTNHGLVDAKDVRVTLPDDPNYIVTALVDHIDTLSAMSSVDIPITIRMRDSSPAIQSLNDQTSAGIEAPGPLSALGQTVSLAPQASTPISVTNTLASCLGIKVDYSYQCNGARDVQIPVNLGIIACVDKVEQAVLDGKLADPCTISSFVLSCISKYTPAGNFYNDPCVKAIFSVACKYIAGGGNIGKALESSWEGILSCLCALSDFATYDPLLPPPIQPVGTPTPPAINLPIYVPVPRPVGLPPGKFTQPTYGHSPSTPYLTSIGFATPGDCTSQVKVTANPPYAGPSAAEDNPATPAADGSVSTQSTDDSTALITPQSNAVCASIRLTIEQQAVITRTAFAGTLAISDGDPTHALTNVYVTINITDANGKVSNSVFFITGPTSTGFVSGTDGKLTLSAGANGSLRFLFLPTVDAAPDVATTYQIGGTLHYVQNGVQIDAAMAPAKIRVYPEAKLDLNYFWQRDVIGDDPFTPQVEPSEPFYLGLQVTNVGKGAAADLTITSAQPKIVENEKGLLVDFSIVGSHVGAQAGSNSLTVDLGSIAPAQTVTADWALLSSLQGKFKNFSASFTHNDDSGNLKTSLINSVTVHELIRKVQVTTPTDDGIADFLTCEVPDANHDPDTLWLSTGGQAHVTLATAAQVSGSGALTETLTATQQSGWSTITVADPAPGLRLLSVTRSDGKVIPIGGMVWRTDRTFPPNQPEAINENLLHLLDFNGTGSYTLTFVSDDHTPPHVSSVTQFAGVLVTGPDAVDVQLSKPVVDSSFTPAALSLTLNGAAVSLGGLGIADAGNGLFHLTGLGALTTAQGNYALTVDGSKLIDIVGDHGDNAVTTTFGVSNGAAIVTVLTPVGTPRNTPAGAIGVTFSKLVDPASFGVGALSLTRNGAPVTLGTGVTVTADGTPAGFRVQGIGAVSGADGVYVLTVNATRVRDLAGKAGAGLLTQSWTVDTVAPAIAAIQQLTATTRNTIVASLIVTVSKPIDPASFDSSALSVTKDGVPQSTASASVTQIDATHFKLQHFNDAFVATAGKADAAFNGAYTLTVDATKLRDLAGNAGVGSISESWVINLTGPAAPTNLVIASSAGVPAANGITNTTTVTVSGNLSALGLAVRLTDMTNGADLGYGTVAGPRFSGAVNLVSAGTHTIRARAIDAAGNIADAEITVLVDTTAPSILSFGAVSPNPRTTPVDSIDFTFSKAIDTATLTAAAIKLTLNNSSVAATNIMITALGNNAYRVGNLAELTQAAGTYAFAVDVTQVRDRAGNSGALSASTKWSTASSVRTGFGGFVYTDFNGNGSRDFGPSLPTYDVQETGLAGRTVYIDLANTGTLADGDPTAITAGDGSYSFAALAPGTYSVRVAPFAGWKTTGAATGYQVTVAADEYKAVSYDFGQFQYGSVSGSVFDDQNADGVRTGGEAALDGWTVFIDRHGDNTLHADDPSVVTGADGRYSFANVGVGTLLLGEISKTGYVRTTADPAITVGSGYVGENLDIGNTLAATITGTVFNDVVGLAARATGDAGLSGWTVFLDANNNGLLDRNEQSSVSDNQGNYSFTGLLPGRYTVRVLEQGGYLETTPAFPGTAGAQGIAQSLGSDSAASIEVDCACGGTWAVQGGVDLGVTSVIDAANLTDLTQARQDPRFANLLGQNTTTVVIDTGIDNSHPFFGPETLRAGRSDRIVYEYDFADGRTDASDRNGHGSNIASLIASSDGAYPGVAPDANLIVLKVFDDNGLGNFGYVQKALDWVVANAAAYHISVVNMSFGDGGNWTQAASRYGLGDDLAATSAAGIVTVAAAGNNYAQFNRLGVAYPGSDPSAIAVGSVWSGDFGGPWRVSTGAVDYTTGADHIAAYSQRDPALIGTLAPGSRFNGANASGGVTTMQGTSQAAAYVSGAATLAQQLALTTLGRTLTTAEFAALLRSTGDLVTDGSQNNDNVRNTGLTFPRLNMEKLFEAIVAYNGQPSTLPSVSAGSGTGTITSASAGPGSYSVLVGSGVMAAGKDFGQFKLGTISGTVFSDLNGDGARQAGEAGVSGATVFIDARGTGTLDAADPQATTDASGAYSFGGIGPGSYSVRIVLPAGQVATTADPAVISATSGMAATADFGETTPSAVIGSSGPATTTIGSAYTIALSVQDPGQVVSEWYVDWGDGTLQGIAGNPSSASHSYSRGGVVYTVAAAARDGLGIHDATPIQVAAAPPQQVVAVTEDASSVSVQFNDAFDPAALHLYGSSAQNLGTASVTLVGDHVGAVAGSLVFSADHQVATFVRTGGVLEADTYTLTLQSGPNGFHDLLGGLDGAGTGVPGSGNYTTSFTVSPPMAPVLSLPDIMSAPGQAVNYLVGKAGLPITLTNAVGLTSLKFHIDYDPLLLTVSGIVTGSSPAGTTLSADLTTPGHAVFSFISDTPLDNGPVTIGTLLATVPATALYGQRQLLRLVVDQTTGFAAGTAAAVGDDALEVAGLLGDTNGNAAYDSGDAGLVQRVIVHADGGFAAWTNVDPTVVADVARIGRLLSIDATRIAQEAAVQGQRWFTPVPDGLMVATPSVLASGLMPTSPAALLTIATVDPADPALADPLRLIKASPPITIRLAKAFADFSLAPASSSGLDWQEAFLTKVPDEPTTALRKQRIRI